MKRGAEKQIARDDGSDEEIEEMSEQGFKKANESVLAARPMKGIPKRASGLFASPADSPRTTAASLPPAGDATDAGDAPPKFAGFGGFGAKSTMTPFSFTSPTANATFTPPSAPHAQSNTSDAVANVPTPPTPTPSVSAMAAKPPMSLATKTFASIVDSATRSTVPSSTSAPSLTPPQSGTDDDTTFKYYTALRGLNTCFVSAVSKAMETDPFADIAVILERYNALRVTVQKQYGDRSKTSMDVDKPTSASGSSNIPGASTSKPPPPTTMPVPPKSFAGFGPFPTSTSASTHSAPGFTPKLDSTSTASNSPFSFATPPASSSNASIPAAKSPFTFGSSATATSSSKANPFSSGSNDSGASSSLFGHTTSSGPSAFGSSSSSKTPSTFGGGSFVLPETSKPDKGDSSAGSSNGTVFTGSGGASSSSNPPTTSGTGVIGFGSFNPLASPGGFGSKGSIGNPVGFSFGSPTPEPEPAPTKSASATGFPFSVASSESKNGKDVRAFTPGSDATGDKTDSRATTEPREETPAGEEVDEMNKPPKISGPNPHDEEGEGEEDEETTHSCKLKVYKMKQRDGKPEWGDLGVGILRLKKHKITGKRRVLLRNSGNGLININFVIYSGLNPTRTKNTVAFVGHDKGQKATFRLRLKDDEQASDLKKALDREIALVKEEESAL